MPPEDITPPVATVPVPAGASPANPHTHAKVIDEIHDLFNRVGKIVETDAKFIWLEFETAGSWIKARLEHKQVAMTPAPKVAESAPVVETTKTTAPATTESAPAGEVAKDTPPDTSAKTNEGAPQA